MKTIATLVLVLIITAFSIIKMEANSYRLRHEVKAKFLEKHIEEGYVSVFYEVRDGNSYEQYVADIPMKYVYKEDSVVYFDKKILEYASVDKYYEKTEMKSMWEE